jgi:hypothetical protein
MPCEILFGTFAVRNSSKDVEVRDHDGVSSQSDRPRSRDREKATRDMDPDRPDDRGQFVFANTSTVEFNASAGLRALGDGEAIEHPRQPGSRIPEAEVGHERDQFGFFLADRLKKVKG